jgi:hypothetical protein
MSQASLDFGRSDRIARAYRKVLRTVGDAVDAIGLLEAAGACDCSKSDLVAALADREHRHLRVEWLLAICDAAPPDFRARIIESLVAWQGLVVQPAKELTPEERLARLEQRVATELGPMGARIVEENRR